MIGSSRNNETKCRSIVRKIFYAFGLIAVLSCADAGDDNEQNLFQPESATSRVSLIKFAFTPCDDYHRYLPWPEKGNSPEAVESSDSTLSYDDNVRAWYDYFDKQVTHFEIDRVLDGSGSRMLACTLAAEAGATREYDTLPMLNYLVKQKKASALEYLRFAFEVNKTEGVGCEWTSDKNRPEASPQLERYEDLAKMRAKHTTDPFLKERYHFQIVKLEADQRDFDTTIQLCDEFFGPTSPESPIKYWALARKAGALLVKEDTAQALYQFAQVFNHCDSRKFASLRSLTINEVEYTPEAINYCKTPSEKAAVFALSAFLGDGQVLDMLREMVKCDPQNDLIELVMAREINRNEAYYYKSQWEIEYEAEGGKDFDSDRRETSYDYFEQLRQFAIECAGNQSLADPAYWYTAASYLGLLRQDFSKAAEHLTLARKAMPRNRFVTSQIHLQSLVLYVDQLDRITPEAERDLIALFDTFAADTNTCYSAAFSLACQRIAGLYGKQRSLPVSTGLGCSSQPSGAINYTAAKSFVFRLRPSTFPHWRRFDNSGTMIEGDTASHAVLDEAIEYFTQPKPSVFDQWLIKNAGFSLSDLYELRGLRAMQEFDYATAINSYGHVSDTVWHHEPYKTYLAANPFATSILEVHTSVPADTIVYTPPTYAVKMQKLLATVGSAAGEEAARLNYELGCGIFNLASEGNSWLLVSLGVGTRSDYSLKENTKMDSSDCVFATRARSYFEAASLATHNRELAARATFMAAKCEQIQFYLYRDKRYVEIRATKESKRHGRTNMWEDSLLFLEQKKTYRESFARLNKEFNDTEFQKEAIKECGYYKDYVNGR